MFKKSSRPKSESILFIAALVVGVTLFLAQSVYARVQYGQSQALGVGTVATGHILNYTILNEDISSSTLIAYSKLGLAQLLVDNDIATSSRIALSKLATSTSNFFITDGAQTWNGVKTFGSIPVLPASDPTSANEAVRKSYVDSQSSAPTSTWAFPDYLRRTNATTTTSESVNTIGYFCAVEISTKITLSKLTFRIHTVTTAGTIDVAYYSHDGQNKIFDFTSPSLTATGWFTATGTAVTIGPGVYYAATIPNGTTNVNIEVIAEGATVESAWRTAVSEPRTSAYLGSLTAGTLPATFDPTTLQADGGGCFTHRLDD